MAKKVLPPSMRKPVEKKRIERYRVGALAPYFCVIDTDIPEQPFVWRVREDGTPAVSTGLTRVYKTEADAKRVAAVLNARVKND